MITGSKELAIGLLIGFIAGVGMTIGSKYLFPSETPAAALAAPTLDIPSPAEADEAFKKIKSEQWSLKLGTCEKNTLGPGVACAVEYTNGRVNITRQGTVGFARAPKGWLAVHYN